MIMVFICMLGSQNRLACLKYCSKGKEINIFNSLLDMSR